MRNTSCSCGCHDHGHEHHHHHEHHDCGCGHHHEHEEHAGRRLLIRAALAAALLLAAGFIPPAWMAMVCCVAAYLIAGYDVLLTALRNIRRGEVFVIENVRRIGTLQWCCGAVALICIPAAFCYYPLVFMVAVMGFLCLAVSVLRQVMSAAVTLQEENDLTI